MISDLIGSAADAAGGAVDDAVGEDLAKADEILSGKKREPVDIEKIEAAFIRGLDLSTPDGDVPSTAAAPADPSGPGAPSALSVGKRIEFIHFGQVHRDWARNFHHDDFIDDMSGKDITGIVGSRGVCFRAALAREAVLLAGMARATQAALAEKDEKEGATADLLTMATDLLGGAGSTTQTAAAADLDPFLKKIESDAWKPLNKMVISYADLHTAGVKLHEVRANLRRYVREQLDAKKNPPPAEKGLLSDLPFVGEIPLPPGPFGDVIGFLQKVTGKLYDVQTALIFDLLLNMQLPIEKACLQASLDQIQKKSSPIYPTWFLKPKEEGADEDAPFADYQQGDVVTGDLKKVGALDAINTGVQDAVQSANTAINDAVAPVMDVIDFLSKKVEAAPGVPYLADAFGAQREPGGPILGCEALGKVAVGCFARAIGSGEIPGFMTGFVGTIVENVFAVCAEFLRAVYEKLCSLDPKATISVEEVTEAGRNHLVFKLVDLALEKCGLTELFKSLSFQIPEPPMLPAGINWPKEELSVDPIIALLKNKLAEELGPYLDPVIGYAMSGLAERLNATRAWAAGKSMTMEAHLAQLPSELALMFRNLLGPLWQFLTDTLMGAVNDVMGQVLGPMAGALGVAKDGLGQVTGAIEDAKKKAAQAQAYAKNVEEKAGKLIDELSSMSIGTDDTGDIADVMNAADALGEAVGADPFAEAGAAGGGGAATGPSFPADRKNLGKAKKIEKSEMDKVAAELKWDEAVATPEEALAKEEAQ